MIEGCPSGSLRLPLKVPYKLALGAVTAFDTILARIVVGGSDGYGEATILTGYTSETIEDAWRRAQALAHKIVRLESGGGACARPTRSRRCARSRSPLSSRPSKWRNAIRCSHVDTDQGVPLLAGINAINFAAIEREIEAAVASGYGTLKIKTGFDLDTDLERIAFIQRCNAAVRNSA